MQDIELQSKKEFKKQLTKLVTDHQATIPRLLEGEEYYNHKSKITKQKARAGFDGQTDPNKPDWRIVTNYHQNLVDQKVSYIVGNPISVLHDDEKVKKAITELFDVKFDDKLIDILTDASNKGISWTQIYIDENGELNIYKVPAEQAIPIWKNNECEELSAFVRVYTVNEEQKVEYWTDNTVSYFVFKDGGLIPDYYYGEDNIQTHFEGGSWGKVPFVAFKNNTQFTSDLEMYKTIIDAIDKRLSDTQNTFDESTELLYILKGYEGQDLDEFVANIKYKKAINVSGDGGVENMKIEIPIEATKTYVTMLRDYLIEFGQGVDYQSDKFGNSPSGIALKFLFSNLDLKASKLARKTYVALQQLLWFVVEHNNLNVDYKEIEIKFNYNRMINELEQAQIATMSTGLISKETLLSKHPWVDDVDGELERIDSEQLLFNEQLPSLVEQSNE